MGDAVGKGSFGTVYKGTYHDSPVAIKEMNIEDSEAMEAFSHEVWMSASLNHPALVNLIGFSWSPLCLVLEFISHGDLHDFLQSTEERLTWKQRIKMALDVASAIEYLHTRDPIIIHRDLKTPNCLIAGFSPDDVMVKVTDLGEAVLLAESYTGRDNLQNPIWMAPEILRNESYDHMSDIYSFGIVLWEIVAQKFPFAEFPVFKSPFVTLLEDAIVDGLRPTIPQYCPPAISTLIQNCWQNNSRNRPSAVEIVNRLNEVILQWEQFPAVEISTNKN